MPDRNTILIIDSNEGHIDILNKQIEHDLPNAGQYNIINENNHTDGITAYSANNDKITAVIVGHDGHHDDIDDLMSLTKRIKEDDPDVLVIFNSIGLPEDRLLAEKVRREGDTDRLLGKNTEQIVYELRNLMENQDKNKENIGR